MLSVLLSRRWLGALVLAAVYATAAFFLGQWQWGRYETKHARAERIDSHYSAPARPATDVLAAGPLPLAREWTRVRATGHYTGRELLVRNRPLHATYGYEVLAPLRTAGGVDLLVDRGWVPNSPEGADVRPDVPPLPDGRVTVTGWARQSEPSLGRDLPPGQLASVNVPEAESALGHDVLGGYVLLQRERAADGSAPPRPRSLERPSTDEGPHQAYAFQWWGSMPIGFVLVGFGIRRELREREDEREQVRTPRPRKVRIWDEEDA